MLQARTRRHAPLAKCVAQFSHEMRVIVMRAVVIDPQMSQVLEG